MSDALARFRFVAIAEGISYVVLVFIGMPLKYLAGAPGTVEVVGWIHGILFIGYVVLGARTAADRDWSARWTGWAFAAALVPGGTFWLDRYLRGDSDGATPGTRGGG